MKSLEVRHSFSRCSSRRAVPRLPAWKPSGRSSRQGRLPNINRVFGIILCLRHVASSQGPPSEATRRRTAQHVLDIMSNHNSPASAEVCISNAYHLLDFIDPTSPGPATLLFILHLLVVTTSAEPQKCVMRFVGCPVNVQDVEIRKALHQLPVSGVDVDLWRELAGAVESSGPSGFRAALGWQLFHVPNVSGAKGASYGAARRPAHDDTHLRWVCPADCPPMHSLTAGMGACISSECTQSDR